MRITEQQKQAVERRILSEARALFTRREPAAVGTRDIAQAAAIAHGTLFNYFATKEALGLELVARALSEARATHAADPRAAGSPAEELFAVLAAELRALRPLRRLVAWLAPTLALPPVSEPTAVRVRDEELAFLAGRLAQHGVDAPRATSAHLLWSLAVALLGFWAADTSPGDEETLALLDETSALMARLVTGDGAQGAIR
jgi:AcrR family transcriptional regulator